MLTASDHQQTAQDFLAASDREFAAGDRLQASENYGELRLTPLWL